MQKVIMMVGLPGSMKGTYSSSYKGQGFLIVSSDAIRVEILDSIADQTQNGLVFETLNKRVLQGILDGLNVVIDATNTSYKRRMGIINQIRDKFDNIEIIADFMATPYNKCVVNDKLRDNKVGWEVIRGMYLHFCVPQYFEGFDKINIINSEEGNGLWEYQKKLDKLSKIPQHHPLHGYTIGRHCEEVCDYLYRLSGATATPSVELQAIIRAGMMHDSGKQFCMSFVNSNGIFRDQATFIGHESVGAYDSIFYSSQTGFDIEMTLKIAKYIHWHMLFNNELEDKTVAKFTKLLGEETMKGLSFFNMCDKLGSGTVEGSGYNGFVKED